MSNYPPGAANDPNAPYNEPIPKYKNFTVEVSVEIGTVVKVEAEVDEDGYIEAEDFRNTIAKVLRQKYNIDDNDTTLIDIHVWDWK
jgi:hypothetical protein